MIVDCFPFFNELDLLDVRLHELAPVVDRFVLTEATLTHSGNPKPLFFRDHASRFAGFPIDVVTVQDYAGIDLSNAWNLEHYQRNAGVWYAISRYGLRESDTIISSDMDEIPCAEAVKEFCARSDTIMSLQMGLYYYYMNCYCPKRPWWYPKIFHVTDPHVNASNLRKAHKSIHRLSPGGWHFSYLGDIHYKIESFAHQERNTPFYKDPDRIAHIKDGLRDLYDRNRKYPFTVLTDLSYLPQYVLDNLDRYGAYIRCDSPSSSRS